MNITAQQQAELEGCPAALFEALCDWLADPAEILPGRPLEWRVSPNTRAAALNFWRQMAMLRKVSRR